MAALLVTRRRSLGALAVALLGLGWWWWQRGEGPQAAPAGAPIEARSPQAAAVPEVTDAAPSPGGGRVASAPPVPVVALAPSASAPSRAVEVGAGRANPTADAAVAPGATRLRPLDNPTTPEAEPEPTFPATGDGIREALGFKRYEIKECYEAWLQSQPGLHGKVKVAFEIRTEAGITAVREVKLVDSQLQHTLLEGCIVAAIRELQFEPPADGKLAVTYPLSFESK